MGNMLSQLLYCGPPPSYSPTAPDLIWLRTKLGERIPAKHYPSKRGPAEFTVIYAHANAEDIGVASPCWPGLMVQPVDVFCFEYSGYGRSSGETSEAAVHADIEAAYVYVRDVLEVPWQKLIVGGTSLGTHAALHLASVAKVRGAIVMAPMTSILRIGLDLRFTLPCDVCRNIELVNDIKCPVLVVHGLQDEIVPAWQGSELAIALQEREVAGVEGEEPLFLEACAHNDLDHYGRYQIAERMSLCLARWSAEAMPPDLESMEEKTEPPPHGVFDESFNSCVAD